MKNKSHDYSNNIMLAGFALFLCGSGLTITQESGTFFQIAGVVCMIIAAALFGASIGMRKPRKKK